MNITNSAQLKLSVIWCYHPNYMEFHKATDSIMELLGQL
jgi:hypothetical protein